MMFYMTSKVFQDDFLRNERDDDILNAQYVIVSTRIRVRESRKNIVVGSSMLFPDARVCTALTDEDLRDRYFDQLSNSKPFLATLIKGSIEEGYNIIFISTKKENKIKYLQYLSDFMYIEFDYPVYEYKSYADGSMSLLKYNKEKIMKKCNKILKEAKNKSYVNDVKTEDGRKRIIKDFKAMSTKELKKNLKSRNLYQDDMSRKDMIEMMELFL